MFCVPFIRQSIQNWNKATSAYGQMWSDANQVVWHRSVQMMTGTMSPDEATRMVLEKPVAFARAAQDAGEAAALGRDPGSIVNAAVTPLRDEAHRNVRRLAG